MPTYQSLIPGAIVLLVMVGVPWLLSLFLKGARMDQAEADEIGRMLVELQKREDDNE